MKSDNLEIADLLSDDSFINYCMNTSSKDVAFWESYMAAHPSRRPMVEAAREKFFMLFNALAQADMNEQVNRLSQKISVTETKPVIQMKPEHAGRKLHKSLLFRISAAVVILAVAIILAFNHYNGVDGKAVRTFVSACGERKNIQLPDGSIVLLNAASKIEIDNSFGVSSRNVYLEGEAFFDVKHDAALPFIVHTQMMNVKALGTAFDVKAYSGEKVTETSLIRGLVEVTLKEGQNRRMLLRPNQKIRWVHYLKNEGDKHLPSTDHHIEAETNNLTMELKTTNSGSIKEIAWTENKLIFEDEPLEEISRLLGRWYGANIQFQDEAIRNYRFTGMFEKEDLNTVLGFLKESRHFNYVIEPGDPITVYLSK